MLVEGLRWIFCVRIAEAKSSPPHELLRNAVEGHEPLPKIVSLFCGAGGLDKGYHDAGFDVVLAIDHSAAAIRTHRRNFSRTRSIEADLEDIGAIGVLDALAELVDLGESIGVIGGPPCQGFSRANNQSAARDPRNKLPLLYLDIVEALQAEYDVKFVLFENVVGIRDKKHAEVFSGILSRFEEIGLAPDVDEYSALDFGVAQTRNRIIISAFASSDAARAFSPKKVRRSDLTVRSVIENLPAPRFFERGLKPESIPHHPNHWTMQPRSKRFRSPGGVQSGERSFRRLDWDKPSPTIAFGHREINVHPNGTRRLSIYEAMLLQGFPKTYVLEGTLSEQVEQVSNAVPPPLARALAKATSVALRDGDSVAVGHVRSQQ